MKEVLDYFWNSADGLAQVQLVAQTLAMPLAALLLCTIGLSYVAANRRTQLQPAPAGGPPLVVAAVERPKLEVITPAKHTPVPVVLVPRNSSPPVVEVAAPPRKPRIIVPVPEPAAQRQPGPPPASRPLPAAATPSPVARDPKRGLTLEQQTALVQSLTPFRGQRVQVQSMATDAASREYAGAFESALRKAGWTVEDSVAVSAPGKFTHGIWIGIQNPASPPPAVPALWKTLSGLNVPIGGVADETLARNLIVVRVGHTP